MGLVSNTTPKPPNIRPNPRKTKRKSCIGPGKFIIRKIKDKKIKFFFFHDFIDSTRENLFRLDS